MSIYQPPTAPVDEMSAQLPGRLRRLAAPSTRTVLVSLMLVAVGFGGGVLEARHKGVTVGSSSATAGFAGAAAGRTAAAGAPGGTGGQGGMTFGTVKLVDGDTLYITTTNGSVVKVTTSKTTKVQVSKTSTSGDLKAGASVVVQGTADASGNVTAISISQSAATPSTAANGAGVPSAGLTAGPGAPAAGAASSAGSTG